MPKAKKSLGQHFLADIAVSNRIASSVSSYRVGTILEIGPGRGALTEELVPICSKLIAVERDEALAQRLAASYAGNSESKLTVIEGDARSVTLEELPIRSDEDYVVAANLPYNAALPILLNLLNFSRVPKGIVCMLQLEVAMALCAPEGKRGFSGVMLQSYAATELLFRVPSSAFVPMPKVESAVIKITPYASHRLPTETREDTLNFIFRVFRTPRKQLKNALLNGLQLNTAQVANIVESASVDSSLRPGNLSLEEWQRVYNAWRSCEPVFNGAEKE